MALRIFILFLALAASMGAVADNPPAATAINSPATSPQTNLSPAHAEKPPAKLLHDPDEAERRFQRKILLGFMALMLVIAGWYLAVRRKHGAGHRKS